MIEIREYLDFVQLMIPSPPIATPRYIDTAKGLIFVQLYGVIEYVVTSTISECVSYINSDAVKLSDVKEIILSMALDSELESLINVHSKKWEKRHTVFERIRDDVVVDIKNDVMPTDGKNIRYSQLESIWKTFCLTDAIFHDGKFRGRLTDSQYPRHREAQVMKTILSVRVSARQIKHGILIGFIGCISTVYALLTLFGVLSLLGKYISVLSVVPTIPFFLHAMTPLGAISFGLTSMFFWQREIHRQQQLTVRRGSIVGLLSALIAHPVMFILLATFAVISSLSSLTSMIMSSILSHVLSLIGVIFLFAVFEFIFCWWLIPLTGVLGALRRWCCCCLDFGHTAIPIAQITYRGGSEAIWEDIV
jgi:hypothetical protein